MYLYMEGFRVCAQMLIFFIFGFYFITGENIFRQLRYVILISGFVQLLIGLAQIHGTGFMVLLEQNNLVSPIWSRMGRGDKTS